ncbi:MAG: M12 family metallo-peptidase [Gemmatimonadota bacterium]
MKAARWWIPVAFVVMSACGIPDEPQPQGVAANAAALEEDLLTSVTAPQLSPDQQRWLTTVRNRRHTANVNVAMAARMPGALLQQGRELAVQITPALRVLATGQRVTRRGNEDISWAGPASGSGGWIEIVLTTKGITGTIRVGAQTYTVEPLGGGLHAIALVDESKLPRDDAEPLSGGDGENGDLALVTPDIRRKLSPGTVVLDIVGDTRIDVLVVYTDSVFVLHSDIYGLAQNAIDQTNTSYSNSAISATLNRVITLGVSYNEAGKSSLQQLQDLTGTSDGFMDVVHALRNLYSTDVVVLITGGFTDSVCGRGYLQSTATTAFSVVSWDCAVAPRWTLAHEVGHNYGARHETSNDPGSPYTYGHGFTPSDLAWRTIMTTFVACNNCPRVQFWSNPDVTFPSTGQVMGTTTAENNARVLTERKAALSFFRHPGVYISGPYTIVRFQSAQYTAVTSNGVGPYNYQWRSRTGWNYNWGPWTSWYSTGTTNYTYTSVNGCGINNKQLEVQVTDSRSDVVTNTFVLSVSNPC